MASRWTCVLLVLAVLAGHPVSASRIPTLHGAAELAAATCQPPTLRDLKRVKAPRADAHKRGTPILFGLPPRAFTLGDPRTTTTVVSVVSRASALRAVARPGGARGPPAI